jgi:hypothetical protein
MKARLIKILKNQTVEIHITKREHTVLHYSSVANGSDGPIPEQKKVNTGLLCTMRLVGPAAISICTEEKS